MDEVSATVKQDKVKEGKGQNSHISTEQDARFSNVGPCSIDTWGPKTGDPLPIGCQWDEEHVIGHWSISLPDPSTLCIRATHFTYLL